MASRPVTRIALLLNALALLSCSDNPTPTQPDAAPSPSAAALESASASNSWTDRATLPTGRANMAAGVVYNAAGQPVLYLLGGYVPGAFGGPDQLTSRVDAYNYSTNTWEAKKATGGRAFSNGVGVIGGKLYQSGGLLGNGKPTGALIVYDPVHDAFIAKASMPSRSVSGVTGVIGGKLYVLTGYGTDCACVITRRLYRYDPASNAWMALRTAPNGHGAGVAGIINGKFYVAGGDDGTGNGASAKLDVYNPATDTWKTLAAAPVRLEEASGAVLQNQFYVIGAAGVFAYDPKTNQWQTKAPLHSSRYDLAAASLVSLAGNPRILAVGGRSSDTGYLARENEVYVP